MQNLRDKLLKAGLVTADQVRETEAKRPVPRNDAAPRNEPPPSRAPLPPLPPLPGSKAHQRLEALAQQELSERLRTLAREGEVALEPGETAFHFQTRKGKLRRLELSASQAAALAEGRLAVVERPEPAQIEHSLVTPETAERMLALSPKGVRFWNRPGAPIGFEPGDTP